MTILSDFIDRYTKKIKASPLGYRLARGAFWSLVGTFISRGLGLIGSIFVARIIGKIGFGELGIIQSTVGMFGVFAGFGLGLTATKHISEFRVKDPPKAGRIMALSELIAILSGGAISLMLVIFAPWIAKQTLAAPHLAGLLQVAAGLLFLGAVNGAQTGALSGFEAFRTITRINLLSGLSAFPLMVGGAFLAGVPGVVWGMVASMGVNWFLNHFELRREAAKSKVPISFRECNKELKILWNYSFPATLSMAMVGPAAWVCNAMLVNQANGYAEMGIFNAANKWRLLILFLPVQINAVTLPILADIFGQRDRRSFFKIIKQNIIINNCVAFSIALPLVFLASPIMRSYGSSFEAGTSVFIIMTFTGVLIQASSIMGIVNQSINAIWWGFAINCIWAIILIACSHFLVTHGAFGLACAYAIAYSFHVLLSGFYLYGRFFVFKQDVWNSKSIFKEVSTVEPA